MWKTFQNQVGWHIGKVGGAASDVQGPYRDEAEAQQQADTLNGKWTWWHVAGALLGFWWGMAYPLFAVTALVVGKAIEHDLQEKKP